MDEQINDPNVAGTGQQPKHEHGRGNLFGGIILITIGIIFLLAHYIPRLHFRDLWPILLIVIGILLLRKTFTHSKN
jgi:uncharacterized membrane protein YfcA